jgi:hypothetical protein
MAKGSAMAQGWGDQVGDLCSRTLGTHEGACWPPCFDLDMVSMGADDVCSTGRNVACWLSDDCR